MMKLIAIFRRRFVFSVAAVAVVAGVVGIGLAAGTSGSTGPEDDMDPVRIAPTVATPRVDDIPASAEGIVRAALARLRAPEIADATVGTAPPSTSRAERDRPDETSERPEGTFLFVTIRATGAPGAAVRGMWLANILGGVVNDHLRARGLTPLASIQLLREGPDGKITSLGGGMSNIVPYQRFRDDGREEVAQSVRAGAARHGYAIKDVGIFSGIQHAPAVVIASSRPRDVLARHGQVAVINEIFGDVAQLEGFYLEIHDLRGNAVAKIAAANRAGYGHVWISPEYDDPPYMFGRP